MRPARGAHAEMPDVDRVGGGRIRDPICWSTSGESLAHAANTSLAAACDAGVCADVDEPTPGAILLSTA